MFRFHKHRKHISLHYNKLQELFRATTSTARSPMSFEESATTLFLTIPGPIFPSYTTSSNYLFEYKKIEPGKQKDSVVSTISHLYTRGLIFQVAYSVPMFAKALHCRFFISHYNRKVDIYIV